MFLRVLAVAPFLQPNESGIGFVRCLCFYTIMNEVIEINIFTTREIAIAIIFTVIFIWLFSKEKCRKGFADLLRACCKKVLLIPLALLLFYGALVTYGITKLSFWNWIYLKDILLWIVFVGVPICFNATKKKLEDHYFCNMVIDNLKWTAILEFIMGSFTFSLVGELILQFVLGTLILLQTSCKEENYAQLKKFIDWLLVITGIVLIGFTVKVAIAEFSKYGLVDSLVSLFIPLVFSVFYLPVAYCMAIYSQYNTLYVRMTIRNIDNPKMLRRRKVLTFICCGFSRTRLLELDKFYTQYIVSIRSAKDDHNQFISGISNFPNIRRIKKGKEMLKSIWKRSKIWFALHSERSRYALAKDKWIYALPFILGGLVLFLKLLQNNWTAVEAIMDNATLVGVLGTLLGALLGGIFSLAGAISVGKHQLKAQTQVRRKNVIFRPLYDELNNIHNTILEENPYPQRISFEEEPQTMLKYPQYTAWGRIKLDTRYLETPRKLSNILQQLETDAKEYLSALSTAERAMMQLLNEILDREVGVTCKVVGIEVRLLRHVLSNDEYDLFDDIVDYQPHKDIAPPEKQRVQKLFSQECKQNASIMELPQKRQAWYQTEEACISLLAAMIKRINAQYEE